jgi:hypothetical protein
MTEHSSQDFRIVLHVGPPKTGTTAIQRMLQRRFGAATPQELWYPTPAALGPGHALLADITMGRGRAAPSPEAFLALINRAKADGCRILILSSENFSEAIEMGGTSLRAALNGCVWDLLITLSPIAQRMLSNWQECVKHGLNRAMSDATDYLLGRPGMLPGFVASIATLLEPASTTVIITNARDDAANIAVSFARAAGLPPLLKEAGEAIRANVGLGMVELDVLWRANSALADRGLKPFSFAQHLASQVFEDPAWRQFVPYQPLLPSPVWEAPLREVVDRTRAELNELRAANQVTLIGNVDALDDVDAVFESGPA